MFKTVLEYIIYLNLIISTSAGFLASGIANLFALDNYLYYGLFGFFSTLSVYNIQRLIKSKTSTKTPWLSWVFEHKTLIIIISVLSAFLTAFFFIRVLNNINLMVISLMSLAVLISYFYVVRIGNKNIRELPYIKIHCIALTWTTVIVAFPLMNENILDCKMTMLIIPAHYIYFLAIAIPFDIRDLKYDLLTQRTIPQVVGTINAKLISILLLIITSIILASIFSGQLLTPLFIIAILIQILFVLFATEKRQDFFYSVFLDGAIALLGISYLSMNSGLI
mgnify:CR=1 FL=1